MKKNISSISPLSPMQQGMLFHSLYAPESGVYFEQSTFNLKGKVNVAAWESAWQKVVERHSILRTLFVWENRPTPLQVVLKQVKLPWQNLDWQGLSTTEQQQQLSEFLSRQREQGFPFNQAPLMDCTLIKLSEDSYKFIWNFHHILMDGWCVPIIFKEVFSFYEAEVRGETCYLPTPPAYRDYIAWLNGQDKEAAMEFWRQTLQGFSAPTPLVVDKLQSQNQQQQGSDYQELKLRLSASVSRKLQSVAQKHHVTLSTIVQAAWALLLSRYSGEQDVVFGVTVSGRTGSLPGVEKMVGLLINTLPLRLQISPQQQLIPWLEQIQQLMLELQQYSYSSLVEIQALSELPGGIPLFESILVFQNYPVDSSLFNKDASLQLSQRESFEQTNYPLTVVVGSRDDLLVKISYDPARFESDTIRRMLGHLQTIFCAIAENPQVSLGEIPLLTQVEREQLLVEWNQTESEYPSAQCIHQLFEEQVEQTPDAVALVFEDQQVTYGELNARANQLAHYLLSLGVGPEVLVGICVERSLEMVVGLLGILKAGGAYVPLDPAYPLERLALMIEETQLKVLLTQPSLMEKFFSYPAQLVCLDTDSDAIELESKTNTNLLNSCYTSEVIRLVFASFICSKVKANWYYIAFTSGTTGRPQAIKATHRPLSHFLNWHSQTFGLQESDRFSMLSGLAHDPLLRDIFTPLWLGATLCIPDQEDIETPGQLARWMEQQKVSIAHLTPAMAQLLTETTPDSDEIPSLRYVFFGGDLLTKQDVTRTRKLAPSATCVNFYGATETPQAMGYFLLPNPSEPVRKGEPASLKESVPLGRGIEGAQLLVLNAAQQLAGVGEVGEIYVRTPYLAQGYMGDEKLTQERFIINPFTKTTGDRLYQTGDLARYLPDGNIEFLGRRDHQVKIRGFRIELGEIEAVLLQHPNVREAVVIAREDQPGNKRLVAYIVPEIEPPTTKELRSFLLAKLPDYMIPAVVVTLEAIPLIPIC